MPADATSSRQSVLCISKVTKRFGPLVANDRVSLEVMDGEVVALLGENGAGKTTLMNILFGHYVADEGKVEVFGKTMPPGDPRAAIAAGVGMVHQHFALADNMSVLENIALGTQSPWSFRLDKATVRTRIAQLSRDFGLAIDSDSPVSELSIGERQRVEILKALYRDAKILILDEPTAVLTPGESEALFATLKLLVKRGLSIVFISHKLHEVMAVSDRVVILRGGRLAGWRRTAQTSRQELTALMVGQAVPASTAEPVEPGREIFALQNVSTARHGQGSPLSNLFLALHGGVIVGLAGVSGNGQAALAALLSGDEKPLSGTIRMDGAVMSHWSTRTALERGVARIPEDRHAVGSIGDMSVTENVIAERYHLPRFSRRGFMKWHAARSFAQDLIADYDVKCPSPEARIRLLSGGNMQKLILGRALDPDPVVILANQPTRGLDIGAVAYVHSKLLQARARGAAILLISEDLDEIVALSDEVRVIFKGQLSAAHPRGTFTIQEIGELMAGHGLAEAS